MSDTDRLARIQYLAGAVSEMATELGQLAPGPDAQCETADLKRMMALANAVRTAAWNLVRCAHEELIDRDEA